MNREQQRFSFRTQLTLMMVILVSIILVFVSLFFYHNVKQDVEHEYIQNLKANSKLLAADLAYSVKQFNYDLADSKIEKAGLAENVNEAAAYLTNGSILAYYNKESGISAANLELKVSSNLSNSNLTIIDPIIYDEKQVGFLYIEYQIDFLLPIEKKYYLFICTIALVGLLGAILLAGFFQNKITRPVRKMVEHINQIYHSNNFEIRLRKTRNDELGKLTNEFNQMLDVVQERENELTARSQQLQRLVEVRTEQLYQKAHFDSLTGLPNRYLLVDRVHQAISKSSRTHSNLALLFLDLDRFKVINDNLGHQNGDLLLKEVASRLSKLARDGDTVSRLGGDEFVFLLENLEDPKDAARTAQRILDSFKKPFKLQDHILHVSTSIGISIYPGDGIDDKILLKNADISMYHAKEQGPGHYSFYSKDMNESSLERLAIESNLRNAIENKEFYLLYQPQMRLKDNAFKNAEALIRWNNPALGEVPPSVFVPIAEETGIINQIDLWVISQVCKQISQWKTEGLEDIIIAINVSAGHLISDTLLEHLKLEINKNKIDASHIEIEITEAVFVEKTERTVETLKAIKRLGSRIAIDDFGTGYSSLQYIQDFPADTLKLDGMFIRNLENKESSQGIVRSTIILAHSLGLEIVTECVEDIFQLEFLQEHQCDLAQGFMLSKPLTPEQALVFCLQ